ncbi:MAG: hypothetical protein J6O39_01820 [Treponema sp.]|nr:hypothetical protein [Treponema sp.]
MFFDMTDGDLIMPISDKTGMNSKGNLFMNMGNDLSVNTEDGSLHMTPGWNDSFNDSSFNSGFNGGFGMNPFDN